MNSKQKNKSGIFLKHITKDQSKDTGMAMVLICLLFGYFSRKYHLISLAIILLIVNMIVPNVFQPLAKIWLGISQVLGTIMSKFLLTIIFFIVVTPAGMIRKVFGTDTLNLKKWKKDTHSVFTIRDHLFRPEDIDKPY
jgi:uncharacterized membrane protein